MAVLWPQTVAMTAIGLGARTALSRLALDPPWLGRLLSALVRLGVPAIMRRHGGARERFDRIHAWLQRRYQGLNWYGAVVEVRGARGVVRAGVAGRGQATGAAAGAATLARALIEGEVEKPGIWLAEEVVPLGPFFERLAARALVPVVEARLEPGPERHL